MTARKFVTVTTATYARDIVATLVGANRLDLARYAIAKLFTGTHTMQVRSLLKKYGAQWMPAYNAWYIQDVLVDNAVKDLKTHGFDVRVNLDGVQFWPVGDQPPPPPKKKTAKTPSRSKPSGGGRSAQIDYAYDLVQRSVRRGEWHDTLMGDGMSPPTREQLKKWPSRNLSQLINQLKR